MDTKRLLVMALGAVVVGASPGRAQIAWDSPMLMGPRSPQGLGIHILEPEPGGDIAVMAAWRTSPVPAGLGWRLGLGEDARDELSVFGGVDVSGWLVQYTEDTPVDLIWTLGVGLGVADAAAIVSFPFGLSAGWTLEAEGTIVRPYVTPRVVVDAKFGDGVPRDDDDDDLELDLAVDLGLDLSFDPAWVIRFGATLGQREALLVGLTFPGVSWQ